MRYLLFILKFSISIQSFAQNLYPVEKKRKWGYMNSEGKMVIDFKYDLAMPFNNGYAMVALNRMPCLINKNEKRVIDTGLYQFIGKYNEGLISVMDYKFRRFYLDTTGKVKITLDKEIYDAGTFYKGVARVSKKVISVENKYGFDISNLEYKFAYIKKDGSYITDFIFDDCDEFSNYPARYMQGTKFGLVDTNGTIITKAIYTNISEFNEDLAVVNLNGKFGFVNKKGVDVIKPTYEFARMFNNGLAAVEVNGKKGYINKQGAIVVEPIYEEVRPCAENRCAVKTMNKWGFIDFNGKTIYNAQFDDAGTFSEGICAIKRNGKWGAFDKEGRVVVPFEFDYIGTFENGIAEVVFRGINLYVNRRGELLPKTSD
ncbi:MAG: WG repeat-containing protein [Bacteroidia bacterium]